MTARAAQAGLPGSGAWRAHDAWSPGPPTEPHEFPNGQRATTRWRMSVHPSRASASRQCVCASCRLYYLSVHKTAVLRWRSSAGRNFGRVCIRLARVSFLVNVVMEGRKPALFLWRVFSHVTVCIQQFSHPEPLEISIWHNCAILARHVAISVGETPRHPQPDHVSCSGQRSLRFAGASGRHMLCRCL